MHSLTAIQLCLRVIDGWIDDSDLPKLQSIELDLGVFSGDERDDRRMISDPPFNFKNTLIMRSEIERNSQ